MKNEMIKFVSENFDVIKNNFYAIEIEAINDNAYCDQSDIDNLDDDIYLAINAEELIDVINERSLGVDYDDEDDCEELFDMIRDISGAAH
jgi:hypothetical protein